MGKYCLYPLVISEATLSLACCMVSCFCIMDINTNALLRLKRAFGAYGLDGTFY